MNGIDYARIHLDVARKLWQDSERWVPLFPTYPHLCELQMDAMSIAYDLAVAEAHNAWSGPSQRQAGYAYP